MLSESEASRLKREAKEGQAKSGKENLNNELRKKLFLKMILRK